MYEQMLLGIDTCGSAGTVALARREGERISLLGLAELAGKTYSALLMPRLRELLETHRMSLQQVEAIVVVNGPGSFTGVRVGISAVKGLAEVFVTPVIGVSRLAVLAQKAQARYAALDAGRGEVYFRDDDLQSPREALLIPDELHGMMPLAICEDKLAESFPAAHRVTAPTAFDALIVALPRLLAGDFDDIATLDGNYLRRSDAEVKADALAGKAK